MGALSLIKKQEMRSAVEPRMARFFSNENGTSVCVPCIQLPYKEACHFATAERIGGVIKRQKRE